jgi:ribosome biogenesis GTPase / thiamine phosphate phosphatase
MAACQVVVQGRVVTQQKSLYGIDTALGPVEAALRGVLKRGRKQPVAGDLVEVEITDERPYLRGLVRATRPRRNLLHRPSIANVDQILLVVTLKEPAVGPEIIDRLLVCVEALDLTARILFNKTDLLSPSEHRQQEQVTGLYERVGYHCLEVSAVTGKGVELIPSLCSGTVATLAGPSGVGKSSLLNRIIPDLDLPTSQVSRRTERGIHTTTTTSLLKLGPDTYLADTPGFASIEPPDVDPRDISLFFPEMPPYFGTCRFNDCTHRDEPGCAVRDAAESGDIFAQRYASYRTLFAEVDERARRRPSARNQ